MPPATPTRTHSICATCDARNLANKRYVSDFSTVADARTANTAVFYPGTGRAFYAGVRYNF